MLFYCLNRNLSPVLSIVLIALTRTWETMEDASMNGIRWTFGPRVEIADEEAALDARPLLLSESDFHDEGFLVRTDASQ